MSGQPGALDIDQVSHGFQDLIQAGAIDPAGRLRLGVEDGIPA
jgi:hypothetical protein